MGGFLALLNFYGQSGAVTIIWNNLSILASLSLFIALGHFLWLTLQCSK